MAAAGSEGGTTTDVVVVGAGPVGLFHVFQLGLQELACHVIDVLPEPGGQCVELYGDKPIYDVPGLPFSTGRDLTDRLVRQVAPFRPAFHFGEEVEGLASTGDGQFQILTSAGTRLRTRAVCIAAGVGAFMPRRLKLPGLDPAMPPPDWLSYQAPPRDLGTDSRCIVHGGDDRALAWACDLAERGVTTALLYRRAVYPAAPGLVDRLRSLESDGKITCLQGQPIEAVADAGGLSAVRYLDAEGQVQEWAAQRLQVSLGLSPRLGPLSGWGLRMERKLLDVDPARFETSVPGIHAVGDICNYPGKLKLIVCGFHEATLAAFAMARRLRPEAGHHLEYTTSSARLQALLGVGSATPTHGPG